MASPVLAAHSAAGYLTIRELRPADVTRAYVNWMNDIEVVRYTEQRQITHTTSSVEAFVKEKHLSSVDFLFGIFVEDQHIGNVKLGPLVPHHRRADISYIVGKKDYWGQGVASASVLAVVKFGFTTLSLDKICAGCLANNTASLCVLKKCGFEQEARLQKQFFIDHERVDQILFGLLRKH